MQIKSIIFDYDGVFTKDDYTPVIDAFQKSSGLDRKEISDKIGEHERKWVIVPDSKQFIRDLKKEFNYPGDYNEIVDLLYQRGDSGLYLEMYKFVKWKNESKENKRALAILSSQIAYRVSRVRAKLDRKVGLENFDRVWFSNEVGLMKPFVGVTHDDKNSNMDISGINIFPFVVNQMKYLGYKPENCVFIDDSPKNIISAQAEGINEIVFKNVEQMKKELNEKYNINIDKYNNL